MKKHLIFIIVLSFFSLSTQFVDSDLSSLANDVENLQNLDIDASQKLYNKLRSAVKRAEASPSDSKAQKLTLLAMQVAKHLEKLKNRSNAITKDARVLSELDQEWAEYDIEHRYHGDSKQKLLLAETKKDFQDDRTTLNKGIKAITERLTALFGKKAELEKSLKDAREKKDRTEEQVLQAKLDAVQSRIGVLNYAQTAGTPESLNDKKMADVYEWVNGKPPIEAREERLKALREQRVADRELVQEVDEVFAALRSGIEPRKEDPGICLDDVKKTGGKILSGLSWLGGKALDGLSATPGAFLKVHDWFSEHATEVKGSLYSIFSAMAHYQYTRKGSKNSSTQLYRGLAIGLGIDMQAKKQADINLPIDPLQAYKREPVAIQNVLDRQQATIRDVLTIGGNPAERSAYPYNPHDRLQQILRSSAPGASFPGTPIFDPNYRNFVGQAYNGFPPPQGLAVQGAFLNPQFGAQNTFFGGSGIASNNFQTIDQAAGLRAMAGLASATQVQRQGIENFANQLSQINPPDNSLRSLIDDVGRASAQRAGLTGQNDFLNQIGNNQDPNFLNQLLTQQYNLLNDQYKILSEINQKTFDAIQNFKHADLKIQRDEDGLMIGGPKHWSRHAERRNQTFNQLQELKNQRAQILERIALIQQHPALFYRIISNAPKEPVPNVVFPERPRTFLIRNAWAQEPFKPILAHNWRKILEEEKIRVKLSLDKSYQKINELLPKLKTMTELDPDGVHEINLVVLQTEELNMKAIALQAKDNLEILKKNEAILSSPGLIGGSKILGQYRDILNRLHEEAKLCAEQLSKVEALQIQKVQQYDSFLYFQDIGIRMLKDQSL